MDTAMGAVREYPIMTDKEASDTIWECAELADSFGYKELARQTRLALGRLVLAASELPNHKPQTKEPSHATSR